MKLDGNQQDKGKSQRYCQKLCKECEPQRFSIFVNIPEIEMYIELSVLEFDAVHNKFGLVFVDYTPVVKLILPKAKS